MKIDDVIDRLKRLEDPWMSIDPYAEPTTLVMTMAEQAKEARQMLEVINKQINEFLEMERFRWK